MLKFLRIIWQNKDWNNEGNKEEKEEEMTKQKANKKERSMKQEWQEKMYKMTEKNKSYIISSCITIIVPGAVGEIKVVYTHIHTHTDGRTDGRTRRKQKSGRGWKLILKSVCPIQINLLTNEKDM
jgi:hypothetical protein